MLTWNPAAPPNWVIIHSVGDSHHFVRTPEIDVDIFTADQSVCTPFTSRVVFQVKVALVPVVVISWFGAVVVNSGGPSMSTPNLNTFELPVVPVTLTVTATLPLTVAFANGVTIFTPNLSGCTVMVRVGARIPDGCFRASL
jgi:hypothetical protein